MEERNRSDAIPLPKWGSFQIESNEPGRDFPAGPYNRMIAKLYGTGGGPLEYADIYRPADTSSRLGLANGQAVLPVSEGRMDKTPVTSFSGGQLMHKTRQEDEPSRFGPAVAQHTEGSRQDDRMIAKLHGTGGKPLEYIGKSRMDNTSSVLGLADGQPMPSVLEGMMDKTPVKSFAGDRLMHKTRQEDEPSRFGPAVAQHSEGSRQDDRMIAKSHGTVSKPLEYIDTSRMDNTSSRLGSADGQPVPPVSEGRMDKTPIRSFSGGQLMNKTNQEERPSRFGPAVTQHTEGSRHDNEPVRSGSVEPDNEPVRSGPVEPEHLADKTKMDIGLVQSGTGDDHPADKVYATVVSAAGQSKDLDDKVKWDGAPAGVIFMCNKITKQICFHYGVFGLPAIQLKLVQRIVPGTKLFLFVLESRELHGIFEASSNGGFNLEPFAFGPSFPSQVRFRICRPCRPLMEKDFRKAIEDNYFQHNKFKNELSSQQVLNLLQLFCPEGFLDEKEQKHENLMPNHTHARGKKDRPVSDPAHSQSDLSMEISSQDPQSSPVVDSRQSQYSMLFKGSHMGAQLSVMDASRDYRPPKDDPAVRGQDPMGDQIRMRGLHSIPIEGSRHYYSASVDGPMLSKSPYMDVMGGSQKSLTEETRLVQPSLDRFQRDSTVFSREASGESHQPMVDVRSRALGKTPIEGGHDIYADKRHYISSSSVANGSYSLDANDNYRKSSLYSSGLQPYGSGAQCHMLSEQAEEKGNFPVKDNLQDSMHRSYAPNTGLQSWDGGVSGQRFSDADVERGKFLSHDYLKASDHISRSQLWPRAEVTGRSIEQNMFLQSNPNEREIYTNESDGLRQEQAERLARIDHMYKQDQQRSQENIVFNDSRDLQGGWVDASSFRSHKRVSEDPVDDASNPVKRQHYYNESLGDRMSDGQARSVNGASLGGDWMGNASWAGSNMGKS
jgi:hypothetical protein